MHINQWKLNPPASPPPATLNPLDTEKPDQGSSRLIPLLSGAAFHSSILIAMLLIVGVRKSRRKKYEFRFPETPILQRLQYKFIREACNHGGPNIAIFGKTILNLKCLPTAIKLFWMPLFATDKTYPDKNDDA